MGEQKLENSLELKTRNVGIVLDRVGVFLGGLYYELKLLFFRFETK